LSLTRLRVTRLAAAQRRVLDVHELAACGLTREAIRTRARNGRLFPIYRGVYAVGHPDIPLEGLFLAAVKACGPDAVPATCSRERTMRPARPISRHTAIA
jgi:hypothetical protein